MNQNYLKPFLLLHILFLILISGCVNIEQTTKIKENGSGIIELHYWTRTSNLSMGDELGGLSFNEDAVKQNYNSPNTTVKSVNIEKTDADSSTHVSVNIDFNEFNRLSEAPGFSKMKSSWNKGKDVFEFSYIIQKDSVNVTGMNDYTIEYKFEFPNEVISTNGTKDGNKAIWKKNLSDLKDNIEMTATIKSEGKICGIFGYEFIIVMTGLFFFKCRKRVKQLGS